jgi:hypothetical protein
MALLSGQQAATTELPLPKVGKTCPDGSRGVRGVSGRVEHKADAGAGRGARQGLGLSRWPALMHITPFPGSTICPGACCHLLYLPRAQNSARTSNAH